MAVCSCSLSNLACYYSLQVTAIKLNMSHLQASDLKRRRNVSDMPANPQNMHFPREIDEGTRQEKQGSTLSADGHIVPTKAVKVAKSMLHSNLPAILSWVLVASLIFGGCCSNVRISSDKDFGD